MPKATRLLLLKSAQIPPSAHWITVHPNGVGKGQPVLIEPQPDGSAKVIGGAGGSLNHLRLRGVRSVSEYKQEAASKAKERREAKKAQTAADKAAGVHEAKQEARKQIAEEKRKAERQVIESVAQKAGWQQSELEFPEEDYAHLSEPARAKVRALHHRKLLQRAKDVIQQSRERLVNDASARADAGIGELPLFSEQPGALSVEDLAPVPKQAGGLGFNPDYKGRAEKAGLTPEALEQEAFQQKAAGMTEAQRQAAFARGQALTRACSPHTRG